MFATVIVHTVATAALAAHPTPHNLDNTIHFADGNMYMFSSTCNYDGQIQLSDKMEERVENWLTTSWDNEHHWICIPNK